MLSWGDNSYRDNQRAGATNTRPQGVDKIDTRAVGRRSEKADLPVEQENVSDRVGRSFVSLLFSVYLR